MYSSSLKGDWVIRKSSQNTFAVYNYGNNLLFSCLSRISPTFSSAIAVKFNCSLSIPFFCLQVLRKEISLLFHTVELKIKYLESRNPQTNSSLEKSNIVICFTCKNYKKELKKACLWRNWNLYIKILLVNLYKIFLMTTRTEQIYRATSKVNRFLNSDNAYYVNICISKNK